MNGRWPVTQVEQHAERVAVGRQSTACPSSCSGDIAVIVPTCNPVRVSCEPS